MAGPQGSENMYFYTLHNLLQKRLFLTLQNNVQS
nr:MAG TPA: hypothetical protein [Caudoviricetes sp.]